MSMETDARPRQKPAMTRPPARQRLEARVTAEQKALLERAAALEGRSLTDFVVANAQAAAVETIRRHETIKLSPRDSLAFAEALLNPPVPGAALRRAAESHRELIGDW